MFSKLSEAAPLDERDRISITSTRSLHYRTTTDVSNCEQLLVFVRYATKDSSRSKLLLSNELRATTRREDMYELVDKFFKENGLQWKKLVGSTTDGAPVMLGRKSGFQARVKAVFSSVISVH